MSNYAQSKKARHITAVIYLLFLTFIVGGTLLSQKDNAPKVENELKATETKSVQP